MNKPPNNWPADFDLEDLSNILDLLQTLLNERHATEIRFTWPERTALTALWRAARDLTSGYRARATSHRNERA